MEISVVFSPFRLLNFFFSFNLLHSCFFDDGPFLPGRFSSFVYFVFFFFLFLLFFHNNTQCAGQGWRSTYRLELAILSFSLLLRYMLKNERKKTDKIGISWLLYSQLNLVVYRKKKESVLILSLSHCDQPWIILWCVYRRHNICNIPQIITGQQRGKS